MGPADVARLLILVTVLDSRLSPPSDQDAKARVMAWSAVLDDDLPVGIAEDIVRRHYADSRLAIMPADINTAWRARRARDRDQDRQAALAGQIRAAEERSVPMPAHVRDAVRALERGTVIPDA